MSKADLQPLVETLKQKGVFFEEGLSEPELKKIESRRGFRFPTAYREFLQVALPVNRGFPNWRSESAEILKQLVNRPREGMLFDIEHNGLWGNSWGPRPATLEEALRVGKEHVARAPRLAPIRADEYAQAASDSKESLVYSVRQSDVRLIAEDILSYLAGLFGDRAPADPHQPESLSFWSDVVGSWDLTVPNLSESAPVRTDEQYEEFCQRIHEAGFFANRFDGNRVSLKAGQPPHDHECPWSFGDFWCAKYDFGWLVSLHGRYQYAAPPTLDIFGLSIQLLEQARERNNPPQMSETLKSQHQLVLLDQNLVWKDELAARLAHWERHSWRELSEGQQDEAWDGCSEVLGFPDDSKLISFSERVTWDVASLCFHDGADYDSLEEDLRTKTLKALRQCTATEEEVYALDWQHACYFFRPHAIPDDLDVKSWAVPVYPDGDHYFFLARDFRFGIFGNCVDLTMQVFGQDLLDAFAADPPQIFNKLALLDEERITREEGWATAGWRKLSAEDEFEIRDDFMESFGFWGSDMTCRIPESIRFRTWNVSGWLKQDEAAKSEIAARLGDHLLDAFRSVARADEDEVVSLDRVRHNNTFAMQPHGLRKACWPHSLLPSDDFCFLINADLRYGVIGHPLEKTICVFGEELLDALDQASAFSLADSAG